MATTTVDINNTSYTQVVDSTTNNFIIENHSQYTVNLAYMDAETAPSISTKAFHLLPPNQVWIRADLQGYIYAYCPDGTTSLVKT